MAAAKAMAPMRASARNSTAGHVFATVDYFRQQKSTRRDRGFLFCSEEYLKREADGGRADIVDFRTGRPACSGTHGEHDRLQRRFFGGRRKRLSDLWPRADRAERAGDLRRQYGDEFAGVGIPINAYNPIGVAGPDNFFGVNFDGPSTGALNQFEPAEQDSDVFSQVNRISAFVEGACDVTDGITAYGEYLFSSRKSAQQWRPADRAAAVHRRVDAALFPLRSDRV